MLPCIAVCALHRGRHQTVQMLSSTETEVRRTIPELPEEAGFFSLTDAVTFPPQASTETVTKGIEANVGRQGGHAK